MPMLQPGEQTTQIILWELDDPDKQDDPRFWWPSEPPYTLPDGREASGPKGTSLAELRTRFGGDEIDLPVPPRAATAERVSLSTADWGDPDRTRVIVVHHYRPIADEVAEERARRGDASPFPPEAETVRRRWLAALEAGEEATAAEQKAQFDELLGARGWVEGWQPTDGVEIRPGVYLLDARPRPVG